MEIEGAKSVFSVLLIAGIVLVCIEVFVPGGVIGAIGLVALAGAVILGFSAFPGYGLMVAATIILGSAVAFVLWLRIAPNTWVGKKLTISKDLGDAKGTKAGLEDLLNKTGVTLCSLRPSGFARIDGKRVDVITDGDMIDSGVSVVVTEIESNRVVVRET